MKENTLLVSGGAAGLIVGILLYPFLFDGGAMSHGMECMNTQDIDKHFIEQMIPHHEGAIVMAQLAQQKAVRPEIKTLASGIITAQQKEIVDMKAWYKEWYGKDVSVSVGMMNGDHAMHMDGMTGDLDTLSLATDFDLEFIAQMIPHHEMAVMMAVMMKSSTNRDEMKELADNIISSQSKEINMMRNWQDAWSK